MQSYLCDTFYDNPVKRADSDDLFNRGFYHD